MAVKVKDAAASAQKFVQRAQAAVGDYTKGVTGAGAHWQQNAAAANDAYVAGVTAAANAGRFQKGINKVGGQKYEAAASGKGAQRYPQGVAGAGPSWQAGTQPYLDTIAGMQLPPRAPKGSPANYQRAQAIGQALHAKKVGG